MIPPTHVSQMPLSPAIPEHQVPSTPRRVEVSALLDGNEVVILMHNGHEYRLRLTRANKLILTK